MAGLPGQRRNAAGAAHRARRGPQQRPHPASGEPQRHGGRRRRRRGGPGGGRSAAEPPATEALVVVPALVVAIVVVVGLLALGLGANHNTATPSRPPPPPRTTTGPARHRHRGAPRTSTATHLSSKAPASATAPRHVQAPAGPVPPGFGPESFTAIGTDTWWLLGTAPCSSPPCTSILRTDDGGHSFVGTPAPRTTQVSQLRFANAADGFAYDSQLWVTHDAGAELAPGPPRRGGDRSWPRPTASPTRSSATATRARAGSSARPWASDTWTTLTAAGSAYAGLWAHGSDVLVGADSGATLAVSHNAGVSFTSAPSPSKGLPCDFEEPAAASSGPTAPPAPRARRGARPTPEPISASSRAQPSPTPPCLPPRRPTRRCSAPDKLFRITGAGTHYALVPTVGHDPPAVPGLHRRHPWRRAGLRRQPRPRQRAPVLHQRRWRQLSPGVDRLSSGRIAAAGGPGTQVQLIGLSHQVDAEAAVGLLAHEREPVRQVDVARGGEGIVGPQLHPLIARGGGEVQRGGHQAVAQAPPAGARDRRAGSAAGPSPARRP